MMSDDLARKLYGKLIESIPKDVVDLMYKTNNIPLPKLQKRKAKSVGALPNKPSVSSRISICRAIRLVASRKAVIIILGR